MSHNSSVAMAIKAPQRRGKHGSGADDAPIRRGGVGAGMSTSGDLLIGVDIGGTFTDVVVRRPGEPTRILKMPTTRNDPSRAVLQALDAHGGRLGRAARNDRRASCTARRSRPMRCSSARAPEIGLDHDRGLPRRARDRPADAAPDVRRDARAGDAGVPGARRAAQGGARARRRSGEVVAPLDEASVRRRGDELVAAGVRGDRGLFSVLVPQSARTSGAPREIIARDIPTCLRLAVLRGRSGLPRVRAHRRHRVRCLREAGGRPLSRQPGARARRADVAAPLQVMQSRGGLAGSAIARDAAGAAVSVGAGRRRHRRADRRRGRRLSAISSPSTSAARRAISRWSRAASR